MVTVKRWERGSQQPSAYFRVKLCALFGKSAEALGLIEDDALLPSERAASAIAQAQPSLKEEPMFWTIPYPRNRYFTGRGELLDQLAQQLAPPGQREQMIPRRAALIQPQAIKGLGGIGKTQLAIEYAYRAREQGVYTHILWVHAVSEEAIMSSFVELARLLPDIAVTEEKDRSQLVAALKRWLEQCQHRWLLIFDNADDLCLLQPYLPQQGNGSVLLTTRVHAVGSLAEPLEVEQMSVMEGTQLLLHRAQRQCAGDEERNEAANVVIALDGFPLALDQAGAYIEETGCSFQDYLSLYQNHRQALLARRGTSITHYPDSVATTWALSFQRIEQANPAAAELLRLCAFLAPDHIPEELLREGAAHWPPLLQRAVADLFTFNRMLEALLRFSFVKRLTEEHLLSIHRLVQAVQMDAMAPEEQRRWAERVVCAVNTVFPQNPKDEMATWTYCLRYLEQVQACDTLIQQKALLLADAADLLERAGTYLRECASYTLAESLYQRALQIREQLLGAEHPHVAAILSKLAILDKTQGRYREAEARFQRALYIRESQLGSEHPDVATSLYHLAGLAVEQRKYPEAETLYRRALRIRRDLLGAEHPDVAHVLNGLANLSQGQGKYTEAEDLYRQVLRIWEGQLGPEHPLVVSPLYNLGILYTQQERYAEAEPCYQQALRLRERLLGPDHPRVATLLNGLANLYLEQQKYTEAEPLYQRTLRIWEQHFGSDHPHLAYPLNNLGVLYSKQKKYAEAEPLYQRALRIWEQQFGPEHPYVAYPLTGLADVYREQRRFAQAESLYQRALTIREHALEPLHADTADTVYSFAALRHAQGCLQEAALLYQRALTIREHVFGTQHPKTQETRTAYDEILRRLG